MVSPEKRVSIETVRGAVTGAWASPGRANATFVVAPGAGSDLDSPFLAGFTRQMNSLGFATLRFNFPYKEAGRRSPDPEDTLRDSWNSAFSFAQSQSGKRRVFASGKSLGGRMASMCVADGMQAAGLVFLGYPLHPPGRPERIRDEHLYRIRVPMLFIQGTRDPFASKDLLGEVVRKLGRRARLRWIEGGDHSFRVTGKKGDDREIGAALAPYAEAFAKEKG